MLTMTDLRTFDPRIDSEIDIEMSSTGLVSINVVESTHGSTTNAAMALLDVDQVKALIAELEVLLNEIK